ncbi:MAG: glycosyltransferase family 2 protein [Ferruginibacter sp.]
MLCTCLRRFYKCRFYHAANITTLALSIIILQAIDEACTHEYPDAEKTGFEKPCKLRFFVRKNPLKLSVVIVNYNVKYFLEQCLCSVLKACKNIDAEIWVVDNNSTDGSRTYLEPKFPSVHFKWLNENLGFGKANNLVIKELSGDHVLFLNPDTILPEDCFQKCLHFFETTSGCGALGVRMLDGSGRFLKESKRSLPGLRASFYKMAGLSALLPKSKSFAAYYAGHLPEHETNKTAVIAGAFMMMKKEVLIKTGGFDEDYFMYAEDVDLSYRIQKEGYSNYYFPGTSIIHFKGESTQKHSAAYTRHFYGAMHLFINKHYSAENWRRRFMHVSVSAGKTAARLKTGLKKIFSSKKTEHNTGSTAIAGSQPEFNGLLNILKHAASPVLIVGRIGFAKNDTEMKIGELQHINETVREKNIKQVVFCEGSLSFADIIKEIQQIKMKPLFMFHASGSSSIVGSNEKNERGVFIAKP